MTSDDLSNAHANTLSNIDHSLLPLIFNLELKNFPRDGYTDAGELVNIAEVLIKFSSLMVQVYWLKIKSLKKPDPTEHFISQELDHILEQIWAGHLKHTYGYSNSILQHTAAMSESSLLGMSILNPHIFIKWRRIISLKDENYKKFDRELHEGSIPKDYISLLQSLPILKSIYFYKGKIILRDFNSCEIDPFPFFRFFNEYPNPLFLCEIKQKSFEVTLSYEEPYDSEVFECLISKKQNPSENEKFLWIRKIKGFDDVKNVQESIVYLFDSGYKHIVNIANAIISKTGDKESIKRYLASYKEKYLEIDPVKNPMDFLTLLIADLGPLHILRQILGHNQDYLYDYLDYFENIGFQSRQYWLEQKQNYIDGKILSYKGLIGIDEETLQGIKIKIEQDACIWCMLNAAGSQIRSNEGIIDPISRRIQVLQSYKKDKTGNSNSLIETNKVFERTYKFLIIFYFTISKMYYFVQDQNDGSDFIDTDYLLDKEYISGEIEEKYKEISRMPLGILMKTFREEFINCKDTGYESFAMKKLLGRNINDLLLDNRSRTIFDKIDKIATNWIKHDIVIDKCRKEKTEEFFEDAIRLFGFLQYGDFNTHESDEFTLTPIYPMIISFKEAHRNREGMNVYHYEILSFDLDSRNTANSQNSVKILTEQRYYQNENYYCIPNIKKSSKQWWIDPFLIQCSKFDNIINSFRDKYKA
jgi:hypothetical protein